MAAIDVLAFYPWTFAALIGLIGLLVGSFLNVVIYRLPVMMQRDCESQAREYLGLGDGSQGEVFNLAFPASQCPDCTHKIRSWENIPLLSWAVLRGKCSSCKAPISPRYPLVEVIAGALSALVALKFGYSLACVFALVLVWASIALFMIDVDHMLLPDSIVIPGVWLGLGAGYLGPFTSLENAFIGAVSGFLLFAIPAWVFLRLTGRDAMGDGDYKLMALFGAWLGWQMLPLVFLVSTVTAALVGLAFARSRGGKFAFGPFIILGGMVALFFGHDLYSWYFQVNGLHVGASFFY
ncbi:leader peptidase (prepilin peptidase)/N-methyltransferase [Pseudomonas frederiksbergensis]|uniref:prepilin peptidase n=1 Tax=Pseudomonas TaxID=286 RepID=UPI003D1F9FC8